jgi:hypothetical protein
MKQTLVILTLLTTLLLVSAQEKLSREEALKYASAVSADAKQLSGTPIKTDVDPQLPVAIQDGEFGGMVLPQKGLKVSDLAAAKEAIVPIGQMWLLKLTPMRNGEAIPSEKLRLATIQADGEEATVPQCALGVRRKNANALELVVFGKDKEPILTAPIKAISAQQDSPIDLSAERDSDSGQVTLKILGKYEASFAVTELQL